MSRRKHQIEAFFRQGAQLHAAGRLAEAALQHVPDWRWLLAGEDCHWYPTMRLFRQTTRGDWDGVFTRMAEQLA